MASMSSKPPQTHADLPGQPSQSNLPPSISPENKVLSSIISLPLNPSIVYATFVPVSAHNLSSEETIELARRFLVSWNKSAGTSILDSLLPCVRVDKDLNCLYVFGITSHNLVAESIERIDNMQFDGLIASGTSSFNPKDLYPCSPACASQRDPCSICVSQGATPASAHTSSSNAGADPLPGSMHLPRMSLRKVYSAFLDAARDRLIDDIAEASLKASTVHRQIKKFKDGFLLGPMGDRTSSEWGANWEHNVKTRPLIHCHLSLHLAPTRLIIHPILRPTSYIPLLLSAPLVSGTPITLQPYAVPAYFLTNYTGPTSALTAQFEASLSGLGVGRWTTYPVSYIIAWISVQNKQGEDKGMKIIWPSSLCLSYHPSASLSSQPLAYVPSLPAQLQPSPPPPPPPTITLVSSSSSLQHNPSSRPALERRTCTKYTLDSFRSLTLGHTRDLENVAVEVGAYVDSVARERERERERIRREREAGSSTKAATPGPGPSNVTRRPQQNELSAELGIHSAVMPAKTDGDAPVDSDVTMEHSYPSPPSTILPSSTDTNGEAMDTSVEPSSSAAPAPAIPHTDPQADTVQRPPTPPPSTDPTGAQTDDLFGDIDTSWPQPSKDYMSVDFDMGFGMPINTGGVSGSAADRSNVDDFEDGLTFTDDDFSFFDRPSTTTSSRVVSGVTAATPLPIPTGISSTRVETGLTPAAGPAPFGLSPPFYGDTGSGPGPPSTTPGHPGSSPWVLSSLAEAFTPRVDGPPPDLFPPSPGKTAPSHSASATPNIQLSPGSEHAGRKSITRFGPSIFDPIPFALSHRISDGKYASGKFSLPTPPDEEDRTKGWELKYKEATDPRLGVVRKLIGVKRKSSEQGSRESRMSPSWVMEYKDWENNLSMDLDGEKSEESGSEEVDVDDSPMASRPSTPPPAYLPIGPALLHTQFRHSELLPLCTPLRPPGVAVAPATVASTTAAASVPTPVSPAAASGAASEKSKSLEAAAYTVAKEIVENCVWAEAWRSSMTHSIMIPRPITEVWQTDVVRIVDLLERIPAVEGPLNIKTLFELEASSSTADTTTASRKTFEQLEPPMFTVAKSETILQVLPTALRFWEKLGLGPRGGKKNVAAFALFEDNGNERQEQVERWLGDMSATYAAHHLGVHTPGQCSSCPKDGIVPLKFDAFRKNLATLVASLPAFESSIVFYLITPSSAMTMTSPILRQVFAAVKRALKTYPEARIVFQFVPEQIVVNSLSHSAFYELNLELLCHSLYERILLPVDRYMSCRFFEHGERIRNYFQEPAFTLARPFHSKVKFLRQTPLRSLDVVDRHTLLHVGYQLSPCGKWILAACVDQRGEAHDLGVWRTHTDAVETQIVLHVWDFALKFARRANVEWRIVIAKLGSMGGSELDVWMSHLATAVPACQELPMMHVSILSVEQNFPWMFLTPQTTKQPTINKRSSNKEIPSPFYVDASSVTYALFHSTRLPLSPIDHSTRECAAERSFIPDADDLPPLDTLPILALSSTTLIHVPADTGYTSISMLHIHLLHTAKSLASSLTIPDIATHEEITHSYYELTVLAAVRWRFDVNACLPLHLGALHLMYMALGREDLEQCI